MKIHLVVIDPQNDFSTPQGSLFVQGADQDMSRLALMVKRLGKKLDDIHITMDSHRKVDISHPMWWKDSAGKHPSPFTMITADDVDAGFTQYVEVDNATDAKLAKLADFVSRSVSSQSQALGSGGPSKALTF